MWGGSTLLAGAHVCRCSLALSNSPQCFGTAASAGLTSVFMSSTPVHCLASALAEHSILCCFGIVAPGQHVEHQAPACYATFWSAAKRPPTARGVAGRHEYYMPTSTGLNVHPPVSRVL